MIDLSLLIFEQISHISKSEILWQFLHKTTPSTKSISDLDKWIVSELGWFNKNKTNLKAVLLPIPGNLDISLTAFSSNFEEKFIL